MDRYTRNKKLSKTRKNQKSLSKMKLETEILREELNSGVDFVNKLHRERIRMAEAMEREIEKQNELKEKINYLKGEYGRLQKSLKTNEKLLAKTQNDRVALEIEVEATTEQTEKLAAAKTSDTVKNNFPELIVHLNRGDLPTEKSILLTCLGNFIRTMSENEFEEHSWTAKIAENRKGVAGRIRFDHIFMTEADVRLIYKPIVTELGNRFSRSGLNIQAKTKRQNGVVTALDLTIRVPSRIREANLELP